MVIITSSPRQHDRAPPSSSYTILPLCFSSTHTRQSANSAYHNTQPTAEAGLIYITWGQSSLVLSSAYNFFSLYTSFCQNYANFVSFVSPCRLYFAISIMHAMQSIYIPSPRYTDKAEYMLEYARFATAQILRIPHNTSLKALDIVLQVGGRRRGGEKVFIQFIQFIRSSASLARSSCSQFPQLRSLAASCNILINFSDRPFKGSLSFQTKRD